MATNRSQIRIMGSVKGDLLSVHPSLLESLKEMNRTRKKIVHSGYRSNKAKAELFLNTVAKTIMILHFNMEPEVFKEDERL